MLVLLGLLLAFFVWYLGWLEQMSSQGAVDPPFTREQRERLFSQFSRVDSIADCEKIVDEIAALGGPVRGGSLYQSTDQLRGVYHAECVGILAARTGDPGLCEAVEAAGRCHRVFVERAENPAVLPDDPLALCGDDRDCLMQLAALTSDASLCDGLERSFDQGRCHQLFAIRDLDGDHCNASNETTEWMVHQCEEAVSFLKRNQQRVCESLESSPMYFVDASHISNWRDACYFGFALKEENPRLCEEVLSNDYDHWSSRRYGTHAYHLCRKLSSA